MTHLPLDLVNCRLVKIGPGELYVTSDPHEAIATVLGSCIAVCISDPTVGLGGLNHFMLPSGQSDAWHGEATSLRYGDVAIPRLVNEMVQRGARRERMVVKLAGGAQLLGDYARIGARNAVFAIEYLARAGLTARSELLRGGVARRLVFHPVSGRAYVMDLPDCGVV